jgi:DNA-directed RNA polymerase subunit RPC12/RpoP
VDKIMGHKCICSSDEFLANDGCICGGEPQEWNPVCPECGSELLQDPDNLCKIYCPQCIEHKITLKPIEKL